MNKVPQLKYTRTPHLPPSQDMTCELHFRKIAFSDGLQHSVLAYVGLFVRTCNPTGLTRHAAAVVMIV